MSEEYDLKRSKEKVGPLYPVILAKNGKVVDGHHRLKDDPTWPVKVNEDIDTEEKFLKARLVANLHRREVYTHEREEWINDLAEFALTEKGIKLGKISTWIAEEVGYSVALVRKYLDDKYKMLSKVREQQVEEFAIDNIAKQAENKLNAGEYHALLTKIRKEQQAEAILNAGLTLEGELGRLRQFLEGQIDHQSGLNKKRDEIIDMIMEVYKNKYEDNECTIPILREMVNMYMLNTIRRRIYPLPSSPQGPIPDKLTPKWREWGEIELGYEKHYLSGRRIDQLGQDHLIWLLKETLRWEGTHCNHVWYETEEGQFCEWCNIGKEWLIKYPAWIDPPIEEPPTENTGTPEYRKIFFGGR